MCGSSSLPWKLEGRNKIVPKFKKKNYGLGMSKVHLFFNHFAKEMGTF